MKIVDHEHESGETGPEGQPDPTGYSVSVSGIRWPGACAELKIHMRLAANRPGVDAYVPITPTEALALAEVLREFALRKLMEHV